MSAWAEGAGKAGERDMADHWGGIARQWQHVGPPLRPAGEDVEFCSHALREWAGGRGAPRALLLGVTPELYGMPWPEGTDFLAVDHTQAMIDAVWPGPREAAVCAEWLAMRLPADSRDIVLCDGGLHLLAYPGEQRRLVEVLQDILSRGGLCIFRLFVPPPEREAPEAVLEDLLEGRIPNLSILKFRLWMSLLESAAGGVRLGAVWNTLHDAAGSLADLASKIGWPVEHMLAINTYRGSKARYFFATVEEVVDLFCGGAGGFELQHLYTPSYELGEHCPTIVLRRSRFA